MPKVQASILADIEAERDEQARRGGGPAHDDTHTSVDWERFIVECATAKGWASCYGFRKRMVKVAALAIAALESHDRKVAAANC